MTDRSSRTDTYDHTIRGLLSRRSELLTETAQLRERMAVVANDIEAIDRVLDSFGYQGELEGKATPRQARIILFYRNELRQFLAEALRKADRPMTTRELALAICQSEGRDGLDRRLVLDIVRRSSKALREMRRHGMVKSGFVGRNAVWMAVEAPLHT